MIEDATRRGRARRARGRPAARRASCATATLPALERELAAEEAALAALQADGAMLKEEVDADDVAEVVARLDRHPGARA